MNKILRISMIAVLALIANVSFAGVSTIDFVYLYALRNRIVLQVGCFKKRIKI